MVGLWGCVVVGLAALLLVPVAAPVHSAGWVELSLVVTALQDVTSLLCLSWP